jgi:autotransporter-associated beta strand protein
MKLSSSEFFHRLCAFSLCTIISSSPATAAVKTWDGGTLLDDNWNSIFNWDPNGAPESGDSIVFPDILILGDLSTHNNLATDTLFSSITITSGYSISGNRLRLTNGIFGKPNGTLPATISADILLAGQQVFRAETVLDFSSSCAIEAGAFNLTLDANTADSLIHVAGPLNGSGRLKIDGPGEVFLNGDKDFSGPMVVNSDGQLRINSPSNTEALTLNGNLILGNGTGFNVFHAITLDGGKMETPEPGGNDTIRLSGAMDILSGGGEFQIRATDRVILDGGITGTGPLFKSGVGTLELSGGTSNTYSGTFTAESGLTLLNKEDFSGLSATRFAFSGPVVVAGSSFQKTAELRFQSSKQLPSTADLTLKEFSLLNLNGKTQEIANLTVHPGSRVETATSGIGFSPTLGKLAVSRGITMQNLGQGEFKMDGALEIGGADVFWDVPVGASSRINALLTGSSASSSLLKTGDGILTLSGVSSVPKITVSGGQFTVNSQSPTTAMELNGPTAILSGSGSVGGLNVIQGAVVSQVKTSLTIVGSTTFSPNAVIDIGFGVSSQTQLHGQLTCGGPTNLNNAELVISGTGQDFAGVPGDTFPILIKTDTLPVIGTFKGKPNLRAFAENGRIFSINYKGGNGNDVVLTLLDAFPEDTFAPKLKVTSKPPKVTKKKKLIIKGNTSDASGISSVEFQVGKGALETATGTTKWQLKTKLKKGKNKITVLATDIFGNVGSKVIQIKRQ